MSNYSGIKCTSRSPEISCDSDMNLHFLSFDLITAYLSDWRVMGNSSRDVPNIIGNKMWGVLQYYHPLHRLLISVTEQIAAVITHGIETHVRWQRGAEMRAALKGWMHVVTKGWCLCSSLKGHGGPLLQKCACTLKSPSVLWSEANLSLWSLM